MRIRAALSILGTVGIVAGAMAVFWEFSASQAVAEAQSTYAEAFSAQGIELGMSARRIRQLHPDIIPQWQGDGSYRGRFVAGGRAHTISFAPGRRPGPVYRISYREIMPRLSPREITDRFDAEFGPMATGDCAPGQCSMTWKVGGAIGLNVRSRDIADISGRLLTVLTVTATDLGQADQEFTVSRDM